MRRALISIGLAAAALVAPACLAPTRTGAGLPIVPASLQRENPEDQGPFVGRKLRGSTYVARAELESPEEPRACALAAIGSCLGEAITRISSGSAP